MQLRALVPSAVAANPDVTALGAAPREMRLRVPSKRADDDRISAAAFEALCEGRLLGAVFVKPGGIRHAVCPCRHYSGVNYSRKGQQKGPHPLGVVASTALSLDAVVVR